MNRFQKAKMLAESATRLARLIELNAPEIIIESARKSLFKKLMDFPVNSVAQASQIKLDNEMRQDEMDALKKSGYFKDAEDDLAVIEKFVEMQRQDNKPN